MLVLVSPDFKNRGEPKGDDFRWTTPGELLMEGFVCCSRGSCGCDRSFFGVNSRKGTTTALVADRPLSRSEIHRLFVESVLSAGYSQKDAEDMAKESMSLVASASHYKVGDIIRKCGQTAVMKVMGLPRRRSNRRSNPGFRDRWSR